MFLKITMTRLDLNFKENSLKESRYIVKAETTSKEHRYSSEESYDKESVTKKMLEFWDKVMKKIEDNFSWEVLLICLESS